MKPFVVIAIVLTVACSCGRSTSPPRSDPGSAVPGTADAGTTTSVLSGANVLQIRNFGFSTLVVKRGAHVIGRNGDAVSHSITADAGTFDSGVIGGRSDGSFAAPTGTGTYAYHCSLHPSMQGALTVTA
jgi:plastocyanin